MITSAIRCRKGLLLIGVFAVITWGAQPLFLQSQPKPAAVTPMPVKPAAPADRPVMPRGFQQQAVFRDPFQLPKELLPAPPPVTAAGPGASKPSVMLPRLTGVAVGNGTAAAILESNEGSRSYRVGEAAGSYTVSKITLDSVILVGPNGTHVLKMGR